MAKPQKPTKVEDIELHPDAWDRFERSIKAIAKGAPQHRPSKPSRAKTASPKARKPA
jgi:hypothetical protein